MPREENCDKRGGVAAIDHYTARLSDRGWCIIPEAMPIEAVEALDTDLERAFEETPFCQGGFYGDRTKRFGRLLARTPLAAPFVQHEIILGVTTRILSPWCDTIQLNLTQAIALHPGALPQLPHRDQKRGSHASAPQSRRRLRLGARRLLSSPRNSTQCLVLPSH